VKEQNDIINTVKPMMTSESVKYIIMTTYAVLFIVIAFLFNTPVEIMKGLRDIIISTSVLITDYMMIGNIGAAFFQSGLLMLSVLIIGKINKVHINGSFIAVLFTTGGFALFGKNIYNSIVILLGVYYFLPFSFALQMTFFIAKHYGAFSFP